MIEEIEAADLRHSGSGWPVAEADRARIAAHWARLVEANPRLWNGRVLGTVAPGRPGGIAIAGGILSATTVEDEFAAFIAWRDWGFPEIGVRNLFGSALVLSGDGALLYGVMGRHTANAGRIYPPGGSLEPSDVAADGRVGLEASIARELCEETGLDAAEAARGPLLACFDGPRVSVARVFRFAEPAARLAARIRETLEGQAHRELDDIAVVRRGVDLPAERTPAYARMLAARMLGS